MDLREIVKAVGGDLTAGGTRANIPGPGHSPIDRSVSLWLNREGRVVVHSFVGDDWRLVLDGLRSRGLIDRNNRPTRCGATAPFSAGQAHDPMTQSERTAVAERLWRGGRPIWATAAETYAYRRGILRPIQDQSVVRFHPFAPIAVYRNSPQTMPAMLVSICDPEGRFTAVEITYLTAQGRRTTALNTPRKIVGYPRAGSHVRIDPPAETMVVAEGYFTALSASEVFELPVWALLSTTNVRAWRPPAGVRSIVIAADRGKDGEASAEVLRARLASMGVAARIDLPPEPFGDWNDARPKPEP